MLFVSKILVSPARYWEIIVGRILPNTYWPEVFLITAMVNAIPLSRWTYGKRPKNRDREEDAVDKHWKKSKQFQFALVLRQVGLLQAILYVSDVFLVLLKLLDFKFVVKYQAAQVAGSVIFASWFAYNLSRLKYHVLIRNNGVLSLASIKRRKQRKQKQSEDNDPFDGNDTVPGASSGVYNRFANRILDVIIYLCASLSIVDMLGIQAGIAVKSIFGLGSFGTLALSLASKDLAAEFVGGVMVQSTNFFDEGETVVLQDGTRGSVAKIGWLVSSRVNTITQKAHSIIVPNALSSPFLHVCERSNFILPNSTHRDTAPTISNCSTFLFLPTRQHTYILKEDGYIVRVPNSQISHQRIARLKRAPTSKRKRF